MGAALKKTNNHQGQQTTEECSAEHCYCKGYKNNDLATKFNSQPQTVQVTLNSTDNNETLSNLCFNSNDIFGIIIAYLDQTSLLKCYYVSKKWFYSAHCRRSLGHFSLNTKNLLHLERTTCVQGFYNILRSYRKVRSLKLELEPGCSAALPTFSKCIKHFNKILDFSISVSQPYQPSYYNSNYSRLANLIESIISRNSNHIETLFLTTNGLLSRECNLVIDCKKIVFKNLKNVWIKSMLDHMPIRNITYQNCGGGSGLKEFTLRKSIDFETLDHLSKLPLSQIENLTLWGQLQFFVGSTNEWREKTIKFASRLTQIKKLKLGVINYSNDKVPFYALFLSNFGSLNTIQQMRLSHNQINYNAFKCNINLYNNNNNHFNLNKTFENLTHLKLFLRWVWRSGPTEKDAMNIENIIDKFLIHHNYNYNVESSSLDPIPIGSCKSHFGFKYPDCMLLQLELQSIHYENGMLVHCFNYLKRIMFKRLQIFKINGNGRNCIVCNYNNFVATLIVINEFIHKVLGMQFTLAHDHHENKNQYSINIATMPNVKEIIINVAVIFQTDEKDQSHKIQAAHADVAKNLDVCHHEDVIMPRMRFYFSFFHTYSFVERIKICNHKSQ